jgi:ribonuclease Z
MEKIIVLGTGNALVTKCYNTCFAIDDGQETILVDAGGGNGILIALEKTGVQFAQIHHVIVTHEHCDHVLGIVWVIRNIATMMHNNTYAGILQVYCHEDLAKSIQAICDFTLEKKFTELFGDRIQFVAVHDGDRYPLANYHVTFFDIHSTKAMQFGFTMQLQNGQVLTCLGDEPYSEFCQAYVKGSDWVLAEAFCLYGERDRFKPYEKHHSTVKEACELAEEMGVPNLVLWHTEDKNYERRKELYTNEGRQFYRGNLLVPYDLEIIDL